MNLQRRRSPLSGIEVDTVRIDTLDYDGLCAIVRWCGGWAVGPEDPGIPDDLRERAVIALTAPNGAVMYALDGDWMARGPHGFFPVRPWVMAQFTHVEQEVRG